MSFKLYELTEMYRSIAELIGDEEVGKEELEKALSQIEDNIEIKAENIAKLMKSIDGEAIALKTEESRLANRRRALENKYSNIKNYLETQLEIMKVDKIKTPLFTVALQNNKPSVDIKDEDLIPDDFKKTSTIVSISKDEIFAALKEGIEVPGAEIKQTRSLRIR